MLRKTFLILAMVWFGGSACLWAQNGSGQAAQNPDGGPSDTQQRNRFWQANMGTGEYLVELSRIVSVSRHQYVLDGSIIVDEVVVDTTGQALARFYFIKPITDQMKGSGLGGAASRIVDRGRELVDRGAEVAGTDVHNMVIKKFPETTHAKEIEYRLLDEASLGKLYDSAKEAWVTGRGRKFSLQ